MKSQVPPLPSLPMLDFTVAIPTYNGENRLPDVLERLRSQIKTETFSWEVIVVDNNSTDNTKKVVEEYQKNWPVAYPLKYCFEPQQGLCFARQRAVEEAKGKFIGFIDDDNLPTSEWVAEAYAFGKASDDVGAYGSRIYAEFEVSPPENFQRIASLLGLTDRGDDAHLYEPHKKVLPPGAGLVVRRQVWLENVPKKLMLGPKGEDAIAQRGEDLEALLYIQRAGWKIWYNPKMVIYHRIPRQRLEKDYLIKICRQTGLSRYHTRMLSVKTWQRPLAFLAYMLNDIRKIIFHLVTYKTTIRNDIVFACQMELYMASLISPFYIWRRYLHKQRYFFIVGLKSSP
uniref:hormogonium polysaccharide biosynthesis glycosyltransferase HpsE n=2 Tax=Argonema antarcticum TaxID=2942763 RepID=UPI0030D96ABC